MPKKRHIKGASAGPASLPTGAVLVGHLVQLLGLPRGAVEGRLQSSSAQRYYRGDRVDDPAIATVFAALGDALVGYGFTPSGGWKAAELPPERCATVAVHHLVLRWDEAIAPLRGDVLRGADPHLVALAAVRLAVVDLALRVTGWLALSGIDLGDAAEPKLPNIADVLTRLIERTKLSREDVAKACRVVRTTVDDWTRGARIEDDNLSQLAALVERGEPGHRLLSTTRRAIAVSALASRLRAAFGEHYADEVDDLWGALAKLTSTFSRFIARSRLIGEERLRGPTLLLAYGTASEPASFVLSDAFKVEESPAWRAVLDAGPNWSTYLLHAVRVARAAGAATKAGLPPEADRAASLLLLSKPTSRLMDLPSGWRAFAALAPPETQASNRVFQSLDAVDAGDTEGAIAHSRRAVELGAAEWEPHFILGAQLGAAGHVDEGIAECRIAAQLLPSTSSDDRPLVEVGVILTNAQRHTEARRHFDQLRAVTSKQSVHLLYNAGVVEMRCGAFEAALATFDLVTNLDEHHARALDCAAHCAFMAGDARKGEALAKKANLLGASETYLHWKAGHYHQLQER